ncbi:hypothetical protein CROQUDRAFT_542631 [Cronartium quercuum f. sp. fusiforme G11]|uniref:Uncharacterized protein n=1 Tax=Cronartium quercuum f. sp. fusiforme G11 TaxID=708437 RepID=A0A9P6NW11_9BASI|nr:hypothetical protein CROQUDRAFT_542631 [Cronartium quercuum f. sp. fusiforme G11]
MWLGIWPQHKQEETKKLIELQGKEAEDKGALVVTTDGSKIPDKGQDAAAVSGIGLLTMAFQPASAFSNNEMELLGMSQAFTSLKRLLNIDIVTDKPTTLAIWAAHKPLTNIASQYVSIIVRRIVIRPALSVVPLCFYCTLSHNAK